MNEYVTPPVTRADWSAAWPAVTSRLADNDDPELWREVADTVLSQIDARWVGAAGGVRAISVGFFKVVSWLRPHQTRWTLGGGFASGDSYKWHTDQNGIWGSWLSRKQGTSSWSQLEGREPLRRKRGHFALRLAIPGRSVSHWKAAISGEWLPRSPWQQRTDTQCKRMMLGFHKSEAGLWKPVAQWDQGPA